MWATPSYFLLITSKEFQYLSIESADVDGASFSLEVLPGADPITKNTRALVNTDGEWPSSFTLYYEILDSGYLVQQLRPREVIVVSTEDEDSTGVQVGLNQLFAGYYLEFKIECSEQILCGTAVEQTRTHSIQKIDLEDELETRVVVCVFSWGEWIALVDSINVVTAIYMPLGQEKQKKQFVTLSHYGLSEVTQVLAFHDHFATGRVYSFLAIEAVYEAAPVLAIY